MAKKNSADTSRDTASHPPRTPPETVRIIAYDFDGTITTKDTFALFLRYYAGTARWAFNLLKLLPIFCLYVLKIRDRNFVKKHVVRVFFKGEKESHMNARAAQFAQDVIPDLIRPAALKALKNSITQQNTSHYKVCLVSASIEPYLLEWAKSQNLDTVLSTKLRVVNGQLTGEIDGINCWGKGKLAKIASELAQTPYIIAEAYGDSRGDQEMLHAAQESFWQPFRL
jgi:phosphatidylglycerophosphatase C